MAQQLTERQSPYLKEILMGRCYENPPTQEAFSCSLLVDTFMGVLESQLDQKITRADFDTFLEFTAFDSSESSASSVALFVWPPPLTSQAASLLSSSILGHSIVLPETTPGGALLQGLVFCGVDHRLDCPAEYWNAKETAQKSFWEGLYSQFAASVQASHDQVRMVILDDQLTQIPSLWQDHVLPHLFHHKNNATFANVDIMAMDCQAPGVLALTETIQQSIPSSSCTNIPTTGKHQDPNDNVVARSICQVATALDMNSSTIEDADGNTNNQVITVAPHSATADDCRCREEGVSMIQICLYIFCFLFFFGVAPAYAYWSVRHFLPEYQRIPNVGEEQELGTHQHQLPKQ